MLEQAGVVHAVTLDAGAGLVAPLMTQEPERVHVICASRPDLPLKKHRIREVDEGANLILLHPVRSEPERFRQRVDDVWVASNVQLYLDLMASPRRGADQAAHIRQKLLRF